MAKCMQMCSNCARLFMVSHHVVRPGKLRPSGLVCTQRHWLISGLRHETPKRSHFPPCAAGSLEAPGQKAEGVEAGDSADVEVALRNSVDVISSMIEDVCARMAVESAAAFVYDDDLEATAQQVIRDAVTNNLEKMDQMALRVMQLMAESSAKNGDSRMSEIITQMRAETLKQVRRIMPTEVQVLDNLLKLSDQPERRELLKTLSMADLSAIALTASQTVTDMEEASAIPDIAMLARLVVVREEVYATMEELTAGSTRDLRYTSMGVPRSVASFINNLVALDDPVRRRMQLFSALTQACETPSRSQAQDTEAVLERLRPGLLMTTLYILRTDLQDSLLQDGPSQAVLDNKFRDLVMDAMIVIDDISNGKYKRKK